MADILVIDDDPRYRSIITRILTDSGHQVRAAEDGEEGLRMCRAQRPTLVITDIVMPNKEGIETIRELARDNPPIAMLAISGAGPRAIYLGAAAKLGASASLQKPFSASELLTVVQGLLGTEAERGDQ